MDGTEPKIRAMDAADLPAVVSIHLAAFAGYRSSLLGPRFSRRLYRWFLEDHEAVALVDVGPEGPRGFVVGARLGSGPKISRATAFAVVRALLERPWLVAHPLIKEGLRLKLRQWRQPTPPPMTLPGGDALSTVALVGIGVAPSSRGCGVGARLMDGFEAEALRRGYGRGFLGVRLDNAEARRLYERHGWVECPGLGTATAVHYVKLLESGMPAARAPRPDSSPHPAELTV